MRAVTNLWMIVKSIAAAIGRLLYLLLIKLFLIIPTLYILAIWIASLCVPFNLGDYSVFLIVGTILCAVLSALLVLRRTMLAPITKKKTPRTSIVTRPVDTTPDEAGIDVRPKEPSRRQARPAKRSEPEYRDEYPGAAQKERVPQFSTPLQNDGETIVPHDDETIVPRYRGPRDPEYFEHDDEPAPKYYRSRRDPSLYVAEYSTYMEFYRKTSDGRYVFLDREEKN